MADERNFSGEVGQKALIVHENKVLMVRDVGATLWDFPGGRVHTDEDPSEGLKRELLEEVRAAVDVVRPLQTFLLSPKPNTLRFFVVYECVLTSSAEAVLPDMKEVEGMCWVGPSEVATLPTHESWREVLRNHFRI